MENRRSTNSLTSTTGGGGGGGEGADDVGSGSFRRRLYLRVSRCRRHCLSRRRCHRQRQRRCHHQRPPHRWCHRQRHRRCHVVVLNLERVRVLVFVGCFITSNLLVIIIEKGSK